MKSIEGKSSSEWQAEFPRLHDLMALRESFWTNDDLMSFDQAIRRVNLTDAHVEDAKERLKTFCPLYSEGLQRNGKTGGIIESETLEIPKMKNWIQTYYNVKIDGQVLLKCDSHLAISGSIKARGAFMKF